MWRWPRWRILLGAAGKFLELLGLARRLFHHPDGSCNRDSGGQLAHRSMHRSPEYLATRDTKATSYPNQAGQSRIQGPSNGKGLLKIENSRSTVRVWADLCFSRVRRAFAPSHPRKNLLCPQYQRPTVGPPSEIEVFCLRPLALPPRNRTSKCCHNLCDIECRYWQCYILDRKYSPDILYRSDSSPRSLHA